MLKPSTWRETVNATWSFLEKEYEISGDDRYVLNCEALYCQALMIHNSCATHVHVSKREPFTLDELKLVAQAAIWWEPAVCSLGPDSYETS